MPIGGLNRDTSGAPKRETFRPPWVKDNATDAPPAWMQKKLRPVESTTKTMTVASDESATVGNSKSALKPVLKKQSTVRDKAENGVAEKLIMPSERLAKQRSQEKVKVDEKENKPSEKVTKPPEKVTKPAEKVAKPVDKVTKLVEAVTKPAEKITKPVEKKLAETTKPVEPINRPLNNRFRKPTESVAKPAEKDTKPVERKTKSPEKVTKPAEKVTKPAEKVTKPAEKVTKPLEKVTKAEEKPVANSTDKKKIVDVKSADKTKKEEPSKDKTKEEMSKTMATKPPTAVEKSPSKQLPPRKPSLQKQPSRDDMPVKKWRDPLHERVKENIDKTLNEVPKGHTLTKNESLRSLLKPTPPPMPPPMPPKCPPPPEFKKVDITPEKLKKIEQLKSRPRRRPDWSDMMKEVESGKKLKKVVCNDRSSPVITRAMVVKNKGEFIFESEKSGRHNELLKQINHGVKLKKTKTNDRSKPNLEGLRKFRRQMTIEEQLQKSMSQANLAGAPPTTGTPGPAEIQEVPPEEEEIDEMDDIDRVRDDLQSTKQLLAIELRNKEAQVRENKRLLTKIQNLEAELARERAIILQEQQKTVISVTDAYDERLVHSLKSEVDRAKATADDLEKKYLQAAEERDDAQTEVDELKRKNSELEKKLQQALSPAKHQDEEPMSYYVKRQLDFQKQCQLLSLSADTPDTNLDDDEDTGIVPTNVGSRRSSHAIKQLSIQRDSSFEEEEEESSEEEEESEEKKQKRMEKEVKNMRNKIRHLKEKQDRMKKERVAYKMSLKNQQAALKDAKKKYKELKREVDKMAAMMKEVGSDEEDEESEEEEEEKKSSESEEEESETETEADTESETESESEPEDAPLPKKKENLTSRLKRHESRLTALKKGNALLVANVDRMKDDVNKQREESVALQKELDSLVEDFA